MASSSTTCEAARSTGPVVEKAGRNRSSGRADMLPHLRRELAENLGPGVLGRALHEVVTPHVDGQPPLVPDQPRVQLLGVGVDVVGDGLDDHQPDDIGREDQGAMPREGPMDGHHDRMEGTAAEQPPVVAAARLDPARRWRLGTGTAGLVLPFVLVVVDAALGEQRLDGLLVMHLGEWLGRQLDIRDLERRRCGRLHHLLRCGPLRKWQEFGRRAVAASRNCIEVRMPLPVAGDGSQEPAPVTNPGIRCNFRRRRFFRDHDPGVLRACPEENER